VYDFSIGFATNTVLGLWKPGAGIIHWSGFGKLCLSRRNDDLAQMKATPCVPEVLGMIAIGVGGADL